MRRLLKTLYYLAAAGFGMFLLGVVATGISYIYVAPSLPSVDILKDIRLQVPLRIYTRDGRLIAEFGEKRRVPLRYDQIPETMIHAFLAAEDDRFFHHPGVDYQGILRAAINLAVTGKKGQGGGTITMQVARNFFLTRQKTYIRKLREIFLALKIEHELTKEEILDLYLNKIYLGSRAYGVGAAAEVYYGTDVDHLTLAQVAMIAGLPKAPSADNPIANPKRALERRGYVLRRMHELGFIDDQAYAEADAAPVTAVYHGLRPEVDAPYVAEMVRDDMIQRFGDDAYTAGYTVMTTLDSRLQPAAQRALRQDLDSYDRRHGYRGPAGHVELGPEAGPGDWADALKDRARVGDLWPALVLKLADQSAHVFVQGVGEGDIGWDGLSWARSALSDGHVGAAPKTAADVLKVGDIVYVKRADQGWELAEVPTVQGALVSLDPVDGAVVALSGGYDFNQSKFNRVLQAQRQPGSSFKPFVYSAALDKGFTVATVVNDAPVVFADKSLEDVWRPENYSQKFFGPTRLREALVHSRNLVSIRVLRTIGVPYALDYLKRFGFDPDRLPHNLSLALGSASVTPMEMARGYAVFANGGYRITPYYIQRISDSTGKVLFAANPPLACPGCAAIELHPPAPVPAPVHTDTAAAAQAATPASTGASGPVERGTDTVQTPAPGETAAEAAAPVQALELAPQAITPQNAYLVTSMMRDVIRHGTGRNALVLHRDDLAGKTGTTNEYSDAWFGGFNDNLVTVAWAGFDQVQSLGFGETGAHAALPMWIAFMGAALEHAPETPLVEPPGMVTVRIDPKTGLRAGAEDPNAIFDVFRVGHVPDKGPEAGPGARTRPRTRRRMMISSDRAGRVCRSRGERAWPGILPRAGMRRNGPGLRRKRPGSWRKKVSATS